METQLPYATLVAIICAIGYVITGFMGTPWIVIIIESVLLVGAILVLSRLALYSGITDYRTSNEIFIKHYFAPYFSDLFPCLFRGQPI